MSNNRRNIDILLKIVGYCHEINDAKVRFGDSFEALNSDVHYKNSVAMCILQIGELTTHFTEEFRTKYDGMPWQDIKLMRNIAAHRYGKFDIETLWGTITSDIPSLRDYCEVILRSYDLMVQEANVPEIEDDLEEVPDQGIQMQ